MQESSDHKSLTEPENRLQSTEEELQKVQHENQSLHEENEKIKSDVGKLVKEKVELETKLRLAEEPRKDDQAPEKQITDVGRNDQQTEKKPNQSAEIIRNTTWYNTLFGAGGSQVKPEGEEYEVVMKNNKETQTEVITGKNDETAGNLPMTQTQNVQDAGSMDVKDVHRVDKLPVSDVEESQNRYVTEISTDAEVSLQFNQDLIMKATELKDANTKLVSENEILQRKLRSLSGDRDHLQEEVQKLRGYHPLAVGANKQPYQDIGVSVQGMTQWIQDHCKYYGSCTLIVMTVNNL